jgi:hypothetical protein
MRAYFCLNTFRSGAIGLIGLIVMLLTSLPVSSPWLGRQDGESHTKDLLSTEIYLHGASEQRHAPICSASLE